MLEDDADFQEASIALEPPEEEGFDTDEDSGEEDGEGTTLNLCQPVHELAVSGASHQQKCCLHRNDPQ